MTRTAGDTWDIVSSVGLTALFVCAARALDAALEPPLANDEYAARFVAAAGEPNLIAAVAKADPTATAAMNAQWVGVRTRFFDDYFTTAAQSGIRQTVILAAGLDSRAYRLAWPAGSTVFDVDQPQVLAFKQQVLDEQGAVPAARRVTVAVDLRDNWTAALRGHGFDPTQPTAWALEGLLPYLPGAAQDALFDKLDELSVAGSQIAAELGPDAGELQEFVAITEMLTVGDLSPRVTDLWYDDPRVNTKEFLAERHWAVRTVDLTEKAANDYGRPLRGLPPIFGRTFKDRFFTASKGRQS